MKSTRAFSYTALFLALMIISAYIQISLPTPLYTMHITMQLFVSILCGFCLPVKYAGSCMGAYILAGLTGLPVFASGGGIQYILRPTFGFVLGFLFCSLACAFFKQRKNPIRFSGFVRIGMIGLCMYYLSGNLYYYFSFPLLLGTHIPLALSLFNGLVVSVIPDVLIALAACKVAKSLQIFFQ